VLVALATAVPVVAQDDIGDPAFINAPKWQQGQWWVMNVSNYQQQTMGDAYWTPQLQYRYEVIGKQQVQGVPCTVVGVRREGALQSQQKMYYQEDTKQLIKVDTTIQVGGQQQQVEQWVQKPGSRAADNPMTPALIIAPVTLPVFSPTGARGVPEREQKFIIIENHPADKPGVVQQFTQTIRKVPQDRIVKSFEYNGSRAAPELMGGDLFEVSIKDSYGSKSIMRLSSESPFPLTYETPTMRATLATKGGPGQ
jgi:hypothetical protein